MIDTMTKFSKPTDVNDVTMVFGSDTYNLLPPYDEIPKEFKDWPGKHWAVKLTTAWFHSGVKNLKVDWNEGITHEAAMRHLKTCMGSFAPKHEHKTAGVAYLLSLWADGAKWTDAK